jgi:Fe-S oxidoreductase
LILLVDPHSAWFQPEVARAAVGVLERFGFAVLPTHPVSTGRAAISQGALARARAELADVVRAVDAAGPAAAPVVGLEPSELLTLRDEAPALVAGEDREAVMALGQRALLVEELLAGPASAALGAALEGVAAADRHVGLHVHCHVKALADRAAVVGCLERLPGVTVQSIAAGCCGMAGAFGYQRETAGVADAVGELALAPAVRALPGEATVAAPGISCRQQIAWLTGRRAVHPIQVVAQVLGVDDGTSSLRRRLSPGKAFAGQADAATAGGGPGLSG